MSLLSRDNCPGILFLLSYWVILSQIKVGTCLKTRTAAIPARRRAFWGHGGFPPLAWS